MLKMPTTRDCMYISVVVSGTFLPSGTIRYPTVKNTDLQHKKVGKFAYITLHVLHRSIYFTNSDLDQQWCSW